MGLLYIFLSVVLLGAVCYAWSRRHPTENDTAPENEPADGECCGRHIVCEKESLLAAASREIVYYDDEELDRYKGKTADSYTPEETAEFEEVFYTLAGNEVAGWARSLQLRGVELPTALKEEVLLVVSERRNRPDKKENSKP